ncbi:MAG: metalloprotease TldD [Sphingobacteriia bacterium]|nr:metalloprotease TldD [Sphingobacteriia bacterium]
MFENSILAKAFLKNDLSEEFLEQTTKNSLSNFDDGELFLEYVESEKIILDDRKIKTANYSVYSGFGIRGVIDELVTYAHSSKLSQEEILNASQAIISMKQSNCSNNLSLNNTKSNYPRLYMEENPLLGVSFDKKVEILKNIDEYLRSKNELVKQVSAGIIGEWQVVCIIRPNGEKFYDFRPLVRLNISAVVGKDGKQEGGSDGKGGRFNYNVILNENEWKSQADEALRQALVCLEAKDAPAGEMPVVLGPGWPGVLLHEAVGHGLEGDFNRKKLSAFHNLLGKQVASKGVTVIDDGTMQDRRGSLSIDDEGTPTEKTVLIEDGILKGFMQDRLNARLMNVQATGNGRRESYACQPMPRMTNTYMLGGNSNPADIIKSVKKGLYAVSFGGGQVDITSGKFVFSASEAYLIEDGKISHPVKGATLIGNGPDALTKIEAIGNDMKLDKGIGTCGKNGQSVPVGVGQPTLLLSSMTVGGTAV